VKSAYEIQFEGGIFSSFPKIVWKVWAPSNANFSCGYYFKIESGLLTGC
jgi:hypothetical protein